jgi:hypothetical protein
MQDLINRLTSAQDLDSTSYWCVFDFAGKEANFPNSKRK